MTDIDKIIEEQSKIPYNILWYMIHIPREKVKEICEREDRLLILYFLIKECGADKKWQETHDYYSNQKPDVNNPYANYICDSEYESYFKFEKLKEELQESIGLKGKYFTYADYIADVIKN